MKTGNTGTQPDKLRFTHMIYTLHSSYSFREYSTGNIILCRVWKRDGSQKGRIGFGLGHWQWCRTFGEANTGAQGCDTLRAAQKLPAWGLPLES